MKFMINSFSIFALFGGGCFVSPSTAPFGGGLLSATSSLIGPDSGDGEVRAGPNESGWTLGGLQDRSFFKSPYGHIAKLRLDRQLGVTLRTFGEDLVVEDRTASRVTCSGAGEGAPSDCNGQLVERSWMTPRLWSKETAVSDEAELLVVKRDVHQANGADHLSLDLVRYVWTSAGSVVCEDVRSWRLDGVDREALVLPLLGPGDFSRFLVAEVSQNQLSVMDGNGERLARFPVDLAGLLEPKDRERLAMQVQRPEGKGSLRVQFGDQGQFEAIFPPTARFAKVDVPLALVTPD